MRLENIVVGNIIYKYVKHRVRPPASKVPESLDRYEPGKRTIKKINCPYDGMSCLYKQIIKLGTKVS